MKFKILIVDDIEANLHSFRQVLKNDELEIIQANSGAEALELIKDNIFSLIL